MEVIMRFSTCFTHLTLTAAGGMLSLVTALTGHGQDKHTMATFRSMTVCVCQFESMV